MTRTYKRKPGSRKCSYFSTELLNEWLAHIRNGEITHWQAEDHYKIPRKAILNKLKGRRHKAPRKPTIFTEAEESIFVKYTSRFEEFSFLLDSFDIRMIAKSYLDKCGRRVKTLKNIIPGSEWLKRNPALTKSWFAVNIKRNHSEIAKELLTEYIENLKEVTEGIPPENIELWCLKRNPGKKVVIGDNLSTRLSWTCYLYAKFMM